MTLFTRLFRNPTPLEVARAELMDAEIQCMTAMTARDYAVGIVIYNTTRIDRLKKSIKAAETK